MHWVWNLKSTNNNALLKIIFWMHKVFFYNCQTIQVKHVRLCKYNSKKF
jgi:hypothetical protein